MAHPNELEYIGSHLRKGKKPSTMSRKMGLSLRIGMTIMLVMGGILPYSTVLARDSMALLGRNSLFCSGGSSLVKRRRRGGNNYSSSRQTASDTMLSSTMGSNLSEDGEEQEFADYLPRPSVPRQRGFFGYRQAGVLPSIDKIQLVKQSKPTKKPSALPRRTSSSAVALPNRPLVFWENMICGAISRSVAQTVMHPANTMKTMLQSSRGADAPRLSTLMRPSMFRRLTRGAGANFLLSVPHGAVNFAVLELVRRELDVAVHRVPWLQKRSDKLGPGLDFLSSALSTICCSVVSTPQMMVTDNIMAGNFPNLPSAFAGLYEQRGIRGFYAGWWPGLVGKIPSYALTWTFFQQLKQARLRVTQRPAKNYENTIMGCLASGATVCIMMPMDTIKTRLVTQVSRSAAAAAASNSIPYKGIVDCAVRVAREEGVSTFYRGIVPRLLSVTPMIGIQFGVYEAMKRIMLMREASDVTAEMDYDRESSLEEAAMEVAASPEHPYPAPHFLRKMMQTAPKSFLKKKKKEIR